MIYLQRDVFDKCLFDLNITTDTFKREVNVDRRTLEKILSGETTKPQTKTIATMADFLNVPHDVLFAYTKSANKRKIAANQFSPFLLNSPVTHPQHFYGRGDIVRKLTHLWRTTPLQNASIIGPSGIGKTSLFKYLVNISDDQYAVSSDTNRYNRKQLAGLSWLYLDLSIPTCLLYTSPSPRDATLSRMPSSA